MKRDIKTVLHALGVSRSYQGYAYFIEAVRMAAEDPCRLTRVREKIYLPIARRNHTTIFNVEKNLRTVRDRSWLRLAIPLYFLSLYKGGIDAQNTHFQSNKSQNELHFLKYSSIFSFWAKIKRPSVLQPTVKQVYGTEKFIFSIRNDIIILFAL